MATTEILPEIQNVPITDLTVSSLNPRKEKKLDPIELEQLAASIRANGILQPLVVRRAGGKLEVLAGRRRLEAAKLAGLAAVPVVLREFDDQAASSAAVVENEQRAQLRPLDSALAVARRLDAGETVEQVATALGKPANWVARRANLTKLDPAVKKLLEEPSSELRLWPLPTLELLALLPADEQKDMIRFNVSAPPSRTEILRTLAHTSRSLAAAPWDLNDAELVPKAGACTSCPYNSGNCQDLFGDLVLGEKKSNDSVCRNAECWAGKLKALTANAAKAAQQEHGKDLLRVRMDSGYGDPLEVQDTRGAKFVLHSHQFQRVKAGTAGAKPALIVSGKGLGTVIHVTTSKAGAAESSARAAKPAKPKNEPGSKAAVKATTERLERRRMAWRVDEGLKILCGIKPPSAEVMVKLAAVFGTGTHGSGSISPGRAAKLAKIVHEVESAGTTELWAVVFTEHSGLRDQLALRRQVDLDGAHDIVRYLTETLRGAAAWRDLMEAAAVEVPAPKSLQALKQTPAAKPAGKKERKPAPAKRGRKA